MAIKRYLIAPNPYQKTDTFGNTRGPVNALVTQGVDNQFTPVPANVPRKWWLSNEASSNLPESPCTTYFKVMSGKFKGVKVGLASTPDGFTNNTEQSTSSESPIGSLQPVITFNATGARTLSFQFSVFGDLLPPYPDGSGILDYNVVTYCKFLQQIALPTQSGNGKDVAYNIEPPIVYFCYGGLHIKGIFKCDTSFGSTVTNGVIDRATVSISIIETEKILNGEVIL